jgi:uncharacterized protein (TIGR03437 family)
VGFVNAASFQPGLPNGGALATMFVSGLTAPPINAKPGVYVASGLPLPYQLGGVQVGFYGYNAPILAVVIPETGSSQYSQINFQVPLERNIQSGIPADLASGMVVSYNGADYIVAAGVFPAAPYGAFFADTNGFAIAQHASDYSLVTQEHPAHPGEAIIAYGDDFFRVWPGPPIGLPAPLQPLIMAGIVPFQAKLYLQLYPGNGSVNPITGIGPGCLATTPALTTTFLGLAPGQIGVEQVNFVVPANQQPGTWQLFFAVGDGTCSPGVAFPVG